MPCVLASEQPLVAALSSLEANSVDFDGDQIRLGTNVHIEHTFGKIRCDKACIMLEEQLPSKKKVPRTIFLEGNVQIDLKNDSSIVSDKAEIDCKTLQGIFTVTDSEKVIYTTQSNDKGAATLMRTTSKSLQVTMKKVAEEGRKAVYSIQDIQGQDADRIEYQDMENIAK